MQIAWMLLAGGVGLALAAACHGEEAVEVREEGGTGSGASGGGSSGETGRRGSTSSSSASSSSSGGSTSSASSSSSGGSTSSASSSNSSGAADAGNLNEECVFAGNAGCDPGLRCECEGDVNCTCQLGPRGEGPYNAPCNDSNDCLSGFCLSGPATEDGGVPALFCSKICEQQSDCGQAPLSICGSQLGSICIAP